MNLLPIYIHNGEPLYLKEGFPEPPKNCHDNNKDCCWTKGPCKDGECSLLDHDLTAYRADLKTSIDKALRFEESDKLKKLLSPYHIYKSCCRSIDECYCVRDGAYKLPDGWRVVEQHEFLNSMNVWQGISEEQYMSRKNNPAEKRELRIIARLFPIDKQEKHFAVIDPTPSETLKAFMEAQESGKQEIINKVGFEFPSQVNTTASDKTPTPVKTAEEVLPEFLYRDEGRIKIGWHGDTDCTDEWNRFISQFKNLGEMTTK